MKKAGNFKAALALGTFTAAAALLSGMPIASAQSASGPTAPGGGSTPGSFLVPGTNTSIAFHGIIWITGSDYIGPHQGDTGATAIPSLALEGSAAHGVNGGFQLNAKATRGIIQTSTPTAFGELKTYFEFDFDLSSGAQITGSNADSPRLRQAYGTLGPWLIGQTWSNFADLQSWSDGDSGDPTIDAGVPGTTINGRIPQIRYTFLAAGGLSFAGSIEQPITYYNVNGSGSNSNNLSSTTPASAGSVPSSAGGPGGLGGIQQVPAFVGTAELDQPWGHAAFHVALQDLQVRNAYTVSGFNVQNDVNKFGYALYASGHLNTFGKDRLGGGIDYADGALNYGPSDMTIASGQGILLHGTGATCSGTAGAANLNGCTSSTLRVGGIYADYLHYWSDTLRSDLDGGYEKGFRGDGFGSPALPFSSLGSLEDWAWSQHVNLMWSPVPGLVTFTLEADHFHRVMYSGAHGSTEQLIFQTKFFW